MLVRAVCARCARPTVQSLPRPKADPGGFRSRRWADRAGTPLSDGAYLRVATGLDYREIAPVVGARRGGGEEMVSVAVRVSRSVERSQD